MFPTTFSCRLCLKTQTELKALLNQNGEPTRIYEIAAKYFDPMLLTTVICLECWHHIREFHEFQQSVLKAQENLNIIEEKKTLIKLEMVHKDEDDGINLKEDMPIFDSVDTNDVKEFISEDEIPLAECFSNEMQEFEELRTMHSIHKNKNSHDTTDIPALSPISNETINLDLNNGQCPYCPRKLSAYKNILRHIEVLHPKEFAVHKRDRDRELLNAKRLREQKVKNKTVNGITQCPHCDNKFKAKRNIPRHMKKFHPKEYAEYKNQSKPKVDIYSLLHNLENCASVSNNDKSNDTFEEASLLDGLENCDSESKNEKSNDDFEETTVQQKTHEYDAFIAKWKKELECNMCKNSFSNFHLLYVHFKHEHPAEYCHIVCCENKLWSRPDIVEHIMLHLNPSTFKCKMCDKCCTTYTGLNKHIQNVHSEGVKEYPFECNVCEKRFHKKDKLMVHVAIHNTERHYICKICGKGLSTELLLKKHIYNIHRKRLCDHCGKYCSDSNALRLHLIEHAGGTTPQYHCVICSSKFKSRGMLTRHKNVFHNAGSTGYRCNACNKTYPTKRALYQHKRELHDNTIKLELEPKFQCKICNKRFKYKQRLQEHSSTHTGLALYQCPHCPTKFKQKKNIHRHIQKLHSKEFTNSS